MLDFNVTGTQRKTLVKALESLTGEQAVYQGMPTMAFQVGSYTVSKTGEVSGAELSDEYRTALANAGFIPVCESDDPEPAGIVISISREGLSDNTILNFENMISSKGEFISGLSEQPWLHWFRSQGTTHGAFKEPDWLYRMETWQATASGS